MNTTSVLDARSAAAQAKTGRRKREAHLLRQDWILFGLLLVVYVVAGYYITMVLHVYYGDTVSRTALGYFVVTERDPHLASVGFVWTPLLSLMQIPLFPILHWFNALSFAGPLVSAVMGAATGLVLNVMGREYKVRGLVRIPVVLLYGLHPTVLFYAATGMSETVFFLFMAVALLFFLRWARGTGSTTAIAITGLSVALCFWVRYEAAPLLAAVAAAAFVVVYHRYVDNAALFRGALEGIWITLLTPTLYSVGFWMFVNWMIMGDPMYWWTGQYSNVAFTEQFRLVNNPLFHNLVGSIQYALWRVELQTVVYPLLLIYVAGLIVARRSLMPAIPLAVPGVLVAFHIYQSYGGASWGWYRFFSYSIVCSVLLFFWLVGYLAENSLPRKALQGLMIAGMMAAWVTTTVAMNDASIGKEEVSYIQAILTRGAAPQYETRSFAIARRMAAYIREKPIPGPILIDTFQGYALVLFADTPERFIKTQDRDFHATLLNPLGHGVKWILVPKPDESLAISEWVLKTWPSIWEKGVPWATLELDLDTWRLYRVNDTEPGDAEPGTTP